MTSKMRFLTCSIFTLNMISLKGFQLMLIKILVNQIIKYNLVVLIEAHLLMWLTQSVHITIKL